MKESTTAGTAQDGQAGDKIDKTTERLICTRKHVEPGIHNSIRFVRGPDGVLVSEVITAELVEQAQRLTRARAPQDTEGYQFTTVTPAAAKLIDRSCQQAAAAERAVPGASAPAIEQDLRDQHAINATVSRERDAAVAEVKRLQKVLDDSPVDELEKHIEAKNVRIADLTADRDRFQAEVTKVTAELAAATERLSVLERANAALTEKAGTDTEDTK